MVLTTALAAFLLGARLDDAAVVTALLNGEHRELLQTLGDAPEYARLRAALGNALGDAAAAKADAQLPPLPPEPVLATVRAPEVGKVAHVVATSARLREAPSSSGEVIRMLGILTPVRVIAVKGDWAEVVAGTRTIVIEGGVGRLIPATGIRDTTKAARGFVSLTALDAAPPSPATMLEHARRFQAMKDFDRAHVLAARAWALAPTSEALRELVSAAVAARRFPFAVQATLPPRQSAETGRVTGSARLAFGCRGSIADATLEPHSLTAPVPKHAKRHASACAVDVDERRECRPRDTREDMSMDAEENARFMAELKAAQADWDGPGKARFEKRLAALRTLFPGPAYAIFDLEKASGAWPDTWAFEARLTLEQVDECSGAVPMPVAPGDGVRVSMPRRLDDEERLRVALRLERSPGAGTFAALVLGPPAKTLPPDAFIDASFSFNEPDKPFNLPSGAAARLRRTTGLEPDSSELDIVQAWSAPDSCHITCDP
ncbi:MAG: hypothetical protein AB1730_14595 [Myxococcota bacterium]